MKNKKRKASDKIIDFTKIKLKREKYGIDQAINDMVGLDFNEFKITTVALLELVLRKIGRHLKYIHSKLDYMDELLFIENVLNQEHREGRHMSIEQKTELAKSYGIDFKKWSAQASRRQKRKSKENR